MYEDGVIELAELMLVCHDIEIDPAQSWWSYSCGDKKFNDGNRDGETAPVPRGRGRDYRARKVAQAREILLPQEVHLVSSCSCGLAC